MGQTVNLLSFDFGGSNPSAPTLAPAVKSGLNYSLQMRKIVIFASGNGTNAERIVKHFENSDDARVVLVVTNKAEAYVRQRAERLGVDNVVLTGKDMKDDARVTSLLDDYGVDFCVLAGYLLLVPQYIIDYFKGDVVNIHPALLPKHGGKGMYGDRVHADVLACGDAVSGITVHYIDHQFDKGCTIMQAYCPVMKDDTVETLAQRVHSLEYTYFPTAIEYAINNRYE